MKVSELTGQLLDFWAAKANGDYRHVDPKFYSNYPCLKYSSDWACGGPIIEHEKIMLNPIDPCVWGAAVEVERLAGESFMVYENGSTPLIAAMRCFVASKFGEDVPNE